MRKKIFNKKFKNYKIKMIDYLQKIMNLKKIMIFMNQILIIVLMMKIIYDIKINYKLINWK